MGGRWCAVVLLLGCSGDPAATPEAPPDAGSAIDDVGLRTIPDVRAPDANSPARDASTRDVFSLDAAPDAPALDAPRDAPIRIDVPLRLDAPPADLPTTALPVPARLIRALSARPYVEGSCRPVTWRSWPHPAQRCTYGAGLVVTVADPAPARVGAWIVDAAQQIAAVAALRTRDPASYEACLVRIAQHTMSQSSRIFPLEGQIDEGQIFPFLMGVTYGIGTRTGFCGTCYCRINSLTRDEWCRYLAGTSGTTSAACLASYGGSSGWNDAWAAHCLANHGASWDADANPHYRAQAWLANRAMRTSFPDPTRAIGSDVLAALGDRYPVF
jgi:hypothetical protein